MLALGNRWVLRGVTAWSGGGASFSVKSFYRCGKRGSERPMELPKDTQQANSTAQIGCPISTMSTDCVSQIWGFSSPQLLSCVQFFSTPWTVACQAPLSIGFARQEYWSGLPFPSPGNLPDSGIESMSPAWAGMFFPTEPPGKLGN